MRRCSILVLLSLLFLLGFGSCPVEQEVVTLPGYVEPHTPGSGAPEEFTVGAPIETLLGPEPDLNQVTYLRSHLRSPLSTRIVLVLIPGFLGGAKTFEPLAADLVERFAGRLEVWAIDRRPNLLEDRVGAEHALSGVNEPACQSSPPAPDCSIFEGVQFYFADQNFGDPDDFPGFLDFDVNLDGVVDPAFPLVDGLGATRAAQTLVQDDVRFMAHWGLDTYFRDWKRVVEAARAEVGRRGVVLLGGHSQGTTWSTTWAAYDFDPDPDRVESGYSLIDGLVLLEGGGVGPGAETKSTLAEYQQRVQELASPGGPQVFLEDLLGINLLDLGTSGEVASIAGFYQPEEPSVIQRTPTFGSGTVGLLLNAPSTNQAIAGFFLDDDFSPNPAFRASIGFSDDGINTLLQAGGLFPSELYLPGPKPGGLRTWKDYDDPTLPSCPPNLPGVPPGCALLDNGPPSDPDLPASVASPRENGPEREVTPIDNFLTTQFGLSNGFEWYFASGRPNLDFSYGRDSSALVAEHLATVDPGHEGPLVVTQNANVDVPVIAFGGRNGLTPEPKSFDRYLDSIATPLEDQQVVMLEGYAHVDVLTAEDNGVVPPLVSFIFEQRLRKLFGGWGWGWGARGR